jgi:hypothetical protein
MVNGVFEAWKAWMPVVAMTLGMAINAQAQDPRESL